MAPAVAASCRSAAQPPSGAPGWWARRAFASAQPHGPAGRRPPRAAGELELLEPQVRCAAGCCAPRPPAAVRRRLPRLLAARCVAPQASTAREPRPPRAAGCHAPRTPAALRRRLPRPSNPGCVAPQALALTVPPLRCAAGFFGARARAASRCRLPRRYRPRRSARFEPEQCSGEVDILRVKARRVAARARTGPGVGARARRARPGRESVIARFSPHTDTRQTERAAGRTLACALRPR